MRISLLPYFHPGRPGIKSPCRADAETRHCRFTPESLENVMKKAFLLAALFLAAAALSGCGKPKDIIDDIAATTVSAAQA